MSTRIVLFSEDRALAESCRESLTELFGRAWTLIVASPGELLSHRDLVLWDFVPGQISLPLDFTPDRLSRYSFLLHREDLKSLLDLIGSVKSPCPAETIRSGRTCRISRQYRPTLERSTRELGRPREHHDNGARRPPAAPDAG